MAAKSVKKKYEDLVELRYQLYNGLFLTLPLDAIQQTGTLLPLLEEMGQEGLNSNHSPQTIVEDFFTAHRPHFTEKEQIQFLFKIIQYVERQVVLVDALEDAAYSEIHQTYKNNSLRKLMERVSSDGLEEEFKQVLDNFGSRVILTAHPTQFYPGQVLAIITDLAEAVQKNNIGQARDLLQQLGNTPFFNKEKPTPYDEAVSLSWYLSNIFYSAIGNILEMFAPHLADRIDSPKQLISVGFWPGGDRDGNPFVDVKVTRDVAAKLRSLIIACYHADIRKLKRRLSFKGIYDCLEKLEKRLHQEITNPSSTGLSVNELLSELSRIEEILRREHQGLYREQLHAFRQKIAAFGFHFASLDIRQDSRVIKATFDSVMAQYPQLLPPNFAELAQQQQIQLMLSVEGTVDPDQFEDSVIKDSLQSLQVIKEIQQSNGEAGCHRYIISNCRGAIDVARIIALFRLSSWDFNSLSVDIIPLFETINDLAHGGANMTELYNFPDYRAHIKRRRDQQTVMLGFSDGTKDGGYLMANWSIFQAKEAITAASRAAGIEVAFFDGRGGPPARGGGSTYSFYGALGKKIESNQIQVTVQGQTISSNYGTSKAAMHNIRQLLAAGLENNLYDRPERELNEEQRDLIRKLADISYGEYLNFKNDPLFLPYLEEMSTLKYYGRANIGSRPSKRGSEQKMRFEDLRAIPFVGAWAQLQQNVPGYYGLGSAFKALEDNGQLQACQDLYRQSRFFKGLVDNSMQSMSKSNFKLTAYMESHPRFGKFWTLIQKEFKLSVEMALKVAQQSILLEDNPRARLSIGLRQRVVLPLLLIQQYALMKTAQIADENASDTRIDLYEKMVMRSLFGNINASRNSV
ncbi:MAG: phosphoenolpyruvate carboxylase [Pseudohongiella sp.]|nr:phosphoenolpyruvate carboxylase [Pseudohongiella sp.]